jgi:hypothetical protein
MGTDIIRDTRDQFTVIIPVSHKELQKSSETLVRRADVKIKFQLGSVHTLIIYFFEVNYIATCMSGYRRGLDW